MIVGLAGYAGAGKDTAAAALVQKDWRQDAFANTLKAMALDINPCVMYLGLPTTLRGVVEQFGWDAAKREPTVREFLQNLGGAVRAHLGVDIWVEALHQRWIDDADTPLVVSDVRYVNEAKWVLTFGSARYSPSSGRQMTPPYRSTLIWIDRPGVGPVNGHESDQGLVRPLCTHEVLNDGTLEELWLKVLAAVGFDL